MKPFKKISILRVPSKECTANSSNFLVIYRSRLGVSTWWNLWVNTKQINQPKKHSTQLTGCPALLLLENWDVTPLLWGYPTLRSWCCLFPYQEYKMYMECCKGPQEKNGLTNSFNHITLLSNKQSSKSSKRNYHFNLWTRFLSTTPNNYICFITQWKSKYTVPIQLFLERFSDSYFLATLGAYSLTNKWDSAHWAVGLLTGEGSPQSVVSISLGISGRRLR